MSSSIWWEILDSIHAQAARAEGKCSASKGRILAEASPTLPAAAKNISNVSAHRLSVCVFVCECVCVCVQNAAKKYHSSRNVLNGW